MLVLPAVFCCSFALSLLLTPVCRDLALRFGLVDRPDGARKTHARPIPRLGGVAILGAALLASSLTMRESHLGPLLPAVLAMFAVGLCDDLYGLRPGYKLAGQVAAAALACAAGVRIDSLAGYPVHAWYAVPLTVFWLVGCANAVNLIDGVDGLATGVGLFATLTTLVAALLGGNLALALATVPLAGALCGFLRYNFNPASIFLGDCGSLPLGFLLGAYGVIWTNKSATVLGMTAPMMALAIPLLDTAVSIARRLLRGQPVFGADRNHFHHRLLDLGLTPRRVALVLYGVCGLGAALSLLVSLARGQYAGVVVVLFCAAAWTGIQHLGYVEFDIAGRLFHPRTFHRVLDAQIRLRALESALAGAATVEECWTAVRGAALDLGFDSLSMRLDHTFFEDPSGASPARHCWTLDVPLSETEYIRLGHGFRSSPAPMMVEPFAELLRRGIELRLSAFHAGVPDDAPVRIVRTAAASAALATNPHSTPPRSASASTSSQDRPGTAI